MLEPFEVYNDFTGKEKNYFRVVNLTSALPRRLHLDLGTPG